MAANKKEKLTKEEVGVREQATAVETAGGNQKLFLSYYDALLAKSIELAGPNPTEESLFHLALGLSAVLSQACAVAKVPIEVIGTYLETFGAAFNQLVTQNPESPGEVEKALSEVGEKVITPVLVVLDWSELEPEGPRKKDMPN